MPGLSDSLHMHEEVLATIVIGPLTVPLEVSGRHIMGQSIIAMHNVTIPDQLPRKVNHFKSIGCAEEIGILHLFKN